MANEEKKSFESLGLIPWITKQVKSLGMKQPTKIQIECVPKILSGLDCIGAAKTGSGKTFAFALPILQKLSEDPTGYFALVLTPTHELAYQISEQFLVAGKPMGCRVCVIAGGTDQMIESQKLQSRPHIVVAMPGRLADHMSGCDTFSFDALQFLVIDEADRMLNGSFNESLEIIEKYIPKKRQNLFFSATLKDFIKSSSIFPISSNAFEWSELSDVATVETLDQRYILCADYDRDMVLIEALRLYKETNKNSNVIIFTNTKKDCQLLSMTLNTIGLTNVCLHGFMRQRERVAALSQFKSNQVRILIATDVASRGLDIPSVELIMNHRLPKFPNEYIHRVGRTARAGRNGLAISIFRFPRDIEFLASIESAINTKLTEHVIDQKMVERIFMQVSVSKREAEMTLDNTDFDDRMGNYRRKNWIKDGFDPDKMEAIFKQKQKEKEKKRKQLRKERLLTRNPDQPIHDERFNTVDRERFIKKDIHKFKKNDKTKIGKNLNLNEKSKIGNKLNEKSKITNKKNINLNLKEKFKKDKSKKKIF